MLAFARRQVGKPFSSIGMARSIVWPRATNGDSYFCAELVAACLQAGGLMSHSSSPGAATPSSLYKLYKSAGAVAANPCTLRRSFHAQHGNVFNFMTQGRRPGNGYQPVSTAPFAFGALSSSSPSAPRSASPPRMMFKQISTAQHASTPFGPFSAAAQPPPFPQTKMLSLSLKSLGASKHK